MSVYLQPIRDYDVIKFAGGEIHIKLKTDIPVESVVTIEKKIFNSDDIMELLLLNEIVRRHSPSWVVLKMPYIPYARQDRATTKNSPRSLKVFAELINSCKFDRVEVVDPHSMVAENLINKIDIVSPTPALGAFLTTVCQGMNQEIKNHIVLVSPDVGALKKVEHYAKELQINNVIAFHKERDPATGDILGIRQIFGIQQLQNKHIFVVDDICDGGGTFIQLLKAAPHFKSAKSINLFVTHGIFSKGLNPLVEAGFRNIGCTDSFINYQNSIDSRLTIV